MGLKVMRAQVTHAWLFLLTLPLQARRREEAERAKAERDAQVQEVIARKREETLSALAREREQLARQAELQKVRGATSRPTRPSSYSAPCDLHLLDGVPIACLTVPALSLPALLLHVLPPRLPATVGAAASRGRAAARRPRERPALDRGEPHCCRATQARATR